jgi:hypothetical protein
MAELGRSHRKIMCPEVVVTAGILESDHDRRVLQDHRRVDVVLRGSHGPVLDQLEHACQAFLVTVTGARLNALAPLSLISVKDGSQLRRRPLVHASTLTDLARTRSPLMSAADHARSA